jgi:hypothetical protein
MQDGAFTTELDIANRAIQYVGGRQITSLAQANSREAFEISACYNKLRKAELRRSIWTFSTRNAVLYPVNQPQQPSNPTTFALPTAPPTEAQNFPTMGLVPPLWSATVLYTQGTIVDDGTGRYWTLLTPTSYGNQPGASTEWDVYFGSMCVVPFGIQASNIPVGFPMGTGIAPVYNNGDLIYGINPANNIAIARSLTAGNAINPAIPTFWSATNVYKRGDVVYDGVFFWRSQIDLNYNNLPGLYEVWNLGIVDQITGALVVGGDGLIYVSNGLAGSATANPANGASPAFWTPTFSQQGAFPSWNPQQVYNLGQSVSGVDGLVYISEISTNLGINPVGDSGANWRGLGFPSPWVANFSTTTAPVGWAILQGAALADLQIDYPAGTGPAGDTDTANVFILPNGFIRPAPFSPKAGSQSFLGAPGGATYTDYVYQDNFLISRTQQPISLRFAADVTQVADFDEMFCEMLAARIAMAICEAVTQSGAKLQEIEQAYKKFAAEARAVNAIETGTEEPALDDWLQARI